MTTAAEHVVIELVSYAQRSTDEQLQTRIDDTIEIEHRSLVHALVLIIVGMINNGAAATWDTVFPTLPRPTTAEGSGGVGARRGARLR
jgi:hypothetical protein